MAIFPCVHANSQARLFALTPLSPSPARRERGIMECGSEASAHAEADASALQTGQRAAPLSHLVGEGLGVRAKKSASVPHAANPSAVPLSAVFPSPASRERGIMECGSEASAHAEADASALQTGQRAAPLSHSVGEGLGVRATHYAKSANTDTESRCSQRKLGLPKCPFFAVGRYCGFCRSKN
jgi:hypothetical protein